MSNLKMILYIVNFLEHFEIHNNKTPKSRIKIYLTNKEPALTVIGRFNYLFNRE